MSEPVVRPVLGALQRPRAVAIVPVYNGERHLPSCLDALLAADDDTEILVVDDGSGDGGLRIARRYARDGRGRVGVLELGRNRGFAAAVNRGVQCVLSSRRSPDVLAFVNQDCRVSPGWLSPLCDVLADSTVAVAGARLLDEDGVTLQHAGAIVGANGLTSHVGRGSRDPHAWRDVADVDYVCGALMALRPEIWLRLGPFDEGYAPAYYEEVALCRRVRRAGLRVVYVPGSEAVHAEASCSGRDSRTYLHRYHRSRLRFVVRELVSERGLAAWLRAEIAWLAGQRRWRDIAPVLAAYAAAPAFVAEMAFERRKIPAFPAATADQAGARPR